MKRTGFVFLVAGGIIGISCVSMLAQALPARPAQPPLSPPVPIQAPLPPPQVPIENFLAFDAQQKEVSVTNGTPESHFVFNLTNVSPGDVVINYVQTSCGCTVAKLPSTPWKLAAKESGQISATMKLAGTPPGGSKTKVLTVSTDKGNKQLFVKTIIYPEMNRTNNQRLAMVDRQAVFKGDCARCHAATAKDAAGIDKTGKDLFAAVCDVCHESEHQASFVPNLHHLREPATAEFWKNWIAHGKPGTLMPAFARSEGGILTDVQIDSLVAYLTTAIPVKSTAQNALPMRTAIQ